MNLPLSKALSTFGFTVAFAALAIKAGAVSNTLTSSQLSLNPVLTAVSGKVGHQDTLLSKYISKYIDNPESLLASFGASEIINKKCLVEVLPDDTQHLLSLMASTEKGCTLQLKGEYLFSELPPVINHRLQAAPPASYPEKDSIWYAPVIYAEDGYQIFTGGLQPENFPDLRDHQPAAILVVEQGTVIMDSESVLQNIGIVDRRPEADTGIPVLTLAQPSDLPIKDRLINVHFDHHYPLVSDITEDHPYWNHEETADQTGSVARTVVRCLSNLARDRRGLGSGGTYSRRMAGGGSGGNGGDDPYWHWRVAQIMKRSFSTNYPLRPLSYLWALIAVYTPSAVFVGTSYVVYIHIPSRIKALNREMDSLTKERAEVERRHMTAIQIMDNTVFPNDLPGLRRDRLKEKSNPKK